jgi:hypothetical protein
MNKQQKWLDFIKSLPAQIAAAIGLVTLIIGFVGLFQKNFYLGVTISLGTILVALLCLCIYLAFAKTPPLIEGGKGVHSFENYRPSAIAGIAIIFAVFLILSTTKPSRSFIITAFVGTSTPTLTSTATATLTATATPTTTATPTPTNTPTTTPTPTLTVTPAPNNISLPTNASMPSPTVSVPLVAVPPMLLKPQDSTSQYGNQIDLAWDWPGTLGPDDYFQVEIWNKHNVSGKSDYSSSPIEVAWVKNELYRFDKIKEEYDREYQWRITVVRGIPTTKRSWSTNETQVWEPATQLELVSEPSEIRTFYAESSIIPTPEYAFGPLLLEPKPWAVYPVGEIVRFTWERLDLRPEQYYSLRVVLDNKAGSSVCIHIQAQNPAEPTKNPEAFLRLDCPKGPYYWSVAVVTNLPEGSESQWVENSEQNLRNYFGIGMPHPNTPAN